MPTGLCLGSALEGLYPPPPPHAATCPSTRRLSPRPWAVGKQDWDRSPQEPLQPRSCQSPSFCLYSAWLWTDGTRQASAVQVFRCAGAQKYKPVPKTKAVLLSFAVLGGEVKRCSICTCVELFCSPPSPLRGFGVFCSQLPGPVLGMFCPPMPMLCLASGPRASPGEPSEPPRLLFVPRGSVSSESLKGSLLGLREWY